MSNNLFELNKLSLEAAEEGNWEESLLLAEKALELDPKSYLAHKRRAMPLWYLGRQQEAIKELKESLALETDFASAHYNLACFYAQLSQKELMIDHLKTAIELESYSDYDEMAAKDSDFEAYWSDEDFLKLNPSYFPGVNQFRAIMDGEDWEAISQEILRIGKEVPAKAIDWEDMDEGVPMVNLLEEKAEYLNLEALTHLARLTAITLNLDDFDEYEYVLSALKEKTPQAFEELILNIWRERYDSSDAGHLGGIDYQLLSTMEDFSPEPVAQVVLEGMKSHGPDSLSDFRKICGTVLEDLPMETPLRGQIVEILDTYMHGDLFSSEDIAVRERRVRIALPPPTIKYPDKSSDSLEREKIRLNHFHPAHVINTAYQCSIQTRRPDMNQLARDAFPTLRNFICDQGLPVDLRVDAVQVFKNLGTVEDILTLIPALEDKSVTLLNSLGEVFNKLDEQPPQTKKAVNTLLLAFKATDDQYKQTNMIKALGWFKDERILPTLLDSLESDHGIVRRETLHALGHLKRDEAVPSIEKNLWNDDGQRISAAAMALDRIGSEASLAVLKDEKLYLRILEQAKKNPRWCAQGLTYFKTKRVCQDMISLMKSTKESEAIPYLAKGIAQQGTEEEVLSLIAAGLKHNKRRNYSGRDYIYLVRTIARRYPEGPSVDILERVSNLFKESNPEGLSSFKATMESDGKHNSLPKATPIDLVRERAFGEAIIERIKLDYPQGVVAIEALFITDYTLYPLW